VRLTKLAAHVQALPRDAVFTVFTRILTTGNI